MSVRRILHTVGLLALVLSLICAPGAAQPPDVAPASEPSAVQIELAGNAITYQGYLTDGGLPANGLYDFSFGLYADAAGSQWVTFANPVSDLPVTDGYFTARVDFGDAMYGDVHFYLNGEPRWLRVGVRPGASSGSYTYLTPLQPLTPAPYAQALPGLHTVQNSTSPNVVGGYPWNSVNVNAVGATVGGGGSEASINRVNADYGTVGGGQGNTAGGEYATVGGGSLNTAAGVGATIAGGTSNNAAGADAAIGGGEGNSASLACSAVAGGCGNVAAGTSAVVAGGAVNYANAQASAVGGGSGNTADRPYSTVPGGRSNYAGGDYGFAVGRRAKVYHQGSFVWADSTDADFASSAANQFAVRATAGARFKANNTAYGMLIDNADAAGNGDGLRVYANHSGAAGWAAVFAINSGDSPAVYANSGGQYAGYFVDDIYVGGSCVGCTLVYLALNDGDAALEEGDLVVAAGVAEPLLDTANPVLRVRRAGEAAGGAVVGVVQSRAALVEGEKEGERFQGASRAGGAAARGELLFIVVQGLARVKVDASAGAVAPGQRLAAASLEGHARAQRLVSVEGVDVAEGVPTVGVALEALESGTGLIRVLVNLQ